MVDGLARRDAEGERRPPIRRLETRTIPTPSRAVFRAEDAVKRESGRDDVVCGRAACASAPRPC
jgi:hypothetical protein